MASKQLYHHGMMPKRYVNDMSILMLLQTNTVVSNPVHAQVDIAEASFINCNKKWGVFMVQHLSMVMAESLHS